MRSNTARKAQIEPPRRAPGTEATPEPRLRMVARTSVQRGESPASNCHDCPVELLRCSRAPCARTRQLRALDEPMPCIPVYLQPLKQRLAGICCRVGGWHGVRARLEGK